MNHLGLLYNHALDLNLDFTLAYFMRGYTYCEQGNPSQAIEDFTKAIKLKSDYAGLYRAWACLSAERR